MEARAYVLEFAIVYFWFLSFGSLIADRYHKYLDLVIKFTAKRRVLPLNELINEQARAGNKMRFSLMVTDIRTNGRTYGQTRPHIEMQGRI